MISAITKKNIFSVLVFCCCISLLYFFPFFTWLNSTLSSCFYPFLFVQNKIAVVSRDSMMSKKELLQKYQSLKDSFENVLQENIELKSLYDFNANTQELVEFKQRYALNNALLAQVIFRNFDAGSHYYLIDRGSYAGIKEDMVAIYKNNIVGKVVKVFPFYSKLILLSDHTCKVSAYCDATKTLGIYQGKNNLQDGSLNHVSHLQQTQEGEMIFSSGEGLIYPRGFALGKITHVEKKEIHQRIDVELLIDLTSIDFVYLISKGDCL